MYIKLTNGVPAPYSIGQLRRDNPQVSFPQDPSNATLAAYGMYPLKPTSPPTFDPTTQRVEEGQPALQSGEWVQVWSTLALTAAEVAQAQAERAEKVRRQRARAYRDESDPLFFKAQRGECSMSEWVAKVNEIKARYPD
jgi:hypothetical protein